MKRKKLNWKIKLFLWYAIKILHIPYIDLKHYHSNKDIIEGITFSWTEEYINKIMGR